MTIPTLQYLVAFNNNPTDDPALITTVASPAGTLGAANVWTDITHWVLSDDHQRGRQQELQQFEAGTATLRLRNDDNRFTPWNTSGPYTGLVIPKKLVQIRATWSGTTYTRWTGHVSGWTPEWPDETNKTVTLKVDDAFRFLNMNDITTTGYPDQVEADGAVNYWRMGDPVGSANATDSVGGDYLTPFTLGVSGSYTFGSTPLMPADPTTSVTMTAKAGNFYWLHPTTDSPVTASGGISTDFMIQLPNTYPSDGTALVQLAFTVSGARKYLEIQLFGTTIIVMDGASGGTALHSYTVPNLADGIAHHIMVTLSTAWAATLYMDGTSYGTFTLSAFVTDTQKVTSRIGHNAQTADVTGNFQEWAAYPTVLTSTQAANHNTLAQLPQQSTDARIGRILDIVKWSSGARALDAGSSTVQKVTSSLTSTSSLAHIQQVEATEAGAVFMTTDGKVKFLSRQTLLGNSLYITSQATLGDNTAAGDIPFLAGSSPTRDDLFTYNEAVAARAGGNTQRTIDQTSIDTNGRTTWQPPATLLGTSDTEVLELTQYIVSKFKDPVDRLQSVTVDLYSLANNLPAVIPTLLSLDLLYRVTVERTKMPGGGTAFTQQANVEHIQETISPNQWLVTFALAVADPAWWVLGTAQLGTARLAF